MTLFDDPIDTGVLYRDDNATVLMELPEASVDLVYLDPPFFSNRFYEVIWGEEAEVRSFEDRWAGGIENYIGWMEARVAGMYHVLKPTGSLYLHCDPHASHYLKVMLDKWFGAANFRNEIVWKRTSSHGSGKRWGPVHDVLLYYTKGASYTWNSLPQDYDPAHIASKYRQSDDRGSFTSSDLTGAGLRRGDSGKPWREYDPSSMGRHWAVPSAAVEELTKPEEAASMTVQEKLDLLDANGYILWPKARKGKKPFPRRKNYLGAGVPIQDVINDIPPINSMARERLGYPTQKPEALLERIIAASSNEGDLVLDPFCGCGTTIAVAERLKRRWIGIDVSATAVEIVRRRLLKAGCSPKIENAVQTVEDLKKLKPFEFQNWIIQAVNGTHSPRRVHDMGIDGHWFFTRDPIQVKQSERVGRNVVDNFETAMRRAGNSTGYIVAFSFTRGAGEEVARAKKEEGLDIRLVKVPEVLLLAKRPHGKFGPQPASVEELPIPAPRKRQDLPSAEELVESDAG